MQAVLATNKAREVVDSFSVDFGKDNQLPATPMKGTNSSRGGFRIALVIQDAKR
jgi:hypothetical protein